MPEPRPPLLRLVAPGGHLSNTEKVVTQIALNS